MAEQSKKDDLDAVRDVIHALESFSEEEQKRIIRWACEKLGIQSHDFGSMRSSIDEKRDEVISVNAPKENKTLAEQPDGSRQSKDIRTFVNEKSPKSDNHFSAVVAYYYQFEASQEDRKNSITKNDLIEATRLADYNRLKRPDQTLVNATKAGLLDSAGTRGHYSLNSVGENLVAMTLPDVSSNGSATRTRNKKSKKKTVNKVRKPTPKKTRES